MKLIDSTGQFKTWDDILTYFKGKTVLLDMWGTWCSSCRLDIDQHSAAIKHHFEGQPLDYLYIANFDEGCEKKWREQIAYFNIIGYHILALKALTQSIMTKINGQGYPTYVIIHKNGTYELFKRDYGLDRELLIAQLEKALGN